MHRRPVAAAIAKRPLGHGEQHFLTLLGVCRSVDHLRPLLAQLILAGQLGAVVVLRSVVELLARSIDDPSSVRFSRLLSSHYFHRVPASATFLHNTLIRAHSKSRWPREAVAAFAKMLHGGSFPDDFTFPFLATAAARASAREGGLTHAQALRRGYGENVYVVNTLVSMYAAFEDMRAARKVFDGSAGVLDVVSWNTIIDGYAKVGSLLEARQLFDQMPARNEVSWSAMISGYAGYGELDSAQSLFDRMPPTVGRNVVTWNSMVSGFSKQGLLPLARKFFDDMPERNTVSWNAMISGYALNGEVHAAKELFDRMPEKDVISWSSMISAYVQSSHYKEALEIFNQMQLDRHVKPNEVTMVSLLSACANLAALEQGKWIHSYIDRNKMRLDGDDNLGAALIDMYAKSGCIDLAIRTFRTLDTRNISTWNALIMGLAINGLAYESIRVFEELQSSETKPNDVTFVGVLVACTHGGLVDKGRQYFVSMSNVHGIQPKLKHYGCFVDLLGRAGLLEEAEEVIRTMPMKADAMVIGALLGACRIHKDVQVAERLQKRFLQLKSEEAGCHILLSNIYASVGRWTDASDIRGMLKRNQIRKVPGSSSLEIYGTTYEFIAGDRRHQEINEICKWLDQTGWNLRSEGYIPSIEEVLLDLNEEEKETCLSWHSEKLAIAFALLKSTQSIIRIVKNLRICLDCHSFMKFVSKSYSREILVRDRIRFHHFSGGSCSCNDYW